MPARAREKQHAGGLWFRVWGISYSSFRLMGSSASWGPQVATAVLGPSWDEGGAQGELGFAVRINIKSRPQKPCLLFFICQMKAIFRLRFFFLMSCHHGDGIGNSFPDNIAVKPFVELFAYCDSRRPLELCASLSIKKGVDLSHLLEFLPQKVQVSYMSVSTKYVMRLLDSP